MEMTDAQYGRMNDGDVNPAARESARDYEPESQRLAAPVVRPEHREDSITRVIEQQAAKIPSDVFFFAALGSMAVSLVFELQGNERESRFVGSWVSPLLIMGVYNKLVKVLPAR